MEIAVVVGVFIVLVSIAVIRSRRPSRTSFPGPRWTGGSGPSEDSDNIEI